MQVSPLPPAHCASASGHRSHITTRRTGYFVVAAVLRYESLRRSKLCFADRSSAIPATATLVCGAAVIHKSVTAVQKTYQAMTPIPMKAPTQLSTSATIPLAVKPAGNGAGEAFWPLRSNRSTVLPAALPSLGVPMALQTSK